MTLLHADVVDTAIGRWHEGCVHESQRAMYWLPVIQRFREELRAAEAGNEAQRRLQDVSSLAAHRLSLVEMLQRDGALRKLADSHSVGSNQWRAIHYYWLSITGLAVAWTLPNFRQMPRSNEPALGVSAKVLLGGSRNF
ncbi:MAG TPA: hypothetical protein VHT74_27775 [Acetobacteraceae bacterium]|nr:hypothetical protein [Acetobacteraceae bacterium]